MDILNPTFPLPLTGFVGISRGVVSHVVTNTGTEPMTWQGHNIAPRQSISIIQGRVK